MNPCEVNPTLIWLAQRVETEVCCTLHAAIEAYETVDIGTALKYGSGSGAMLSQYRNLSDKCAAESHLLFTRSFNTHAAITLQFSVYLFSTSQGQNTNIFVFRCYLFTPKPVVGKKYESFLLNWGYYYTSFFQCKEYAFCVYKERYACKSAWRRVGCAGLIGAWKVFCSMLFLSISVCYWE